MRNFNGSMAIFMGLNNNCISRLKKSWALVDPKKMKTLQELEIVFNPQFNYKNYRAILLDSDYNEEASIPVISLIIKDLTFLNDGNPKYLDVFKVNYGKLKNMHNTIKEFQRLINGNLNHSENKTDSIALEYCKNLKVTSEDETFRLSLIIEPRK